MIKLSSSKYSSKHELVLKSYNSFRLNYEHETEVFKSIKERTCECQKCQFYYTLNPRHT